MKVTFQQTSDHISDLWKDNFKQRKGLQMIVVLIALFTLTNIAWQVVQGGFSGRHLLSWGLAILFVGGLWWLLFRQIRKRMFPESQEALITGYREVELLAEGIRYKTTVSDAIFQWQALSKVSESTKNYFLYLGKQRAIIIPKSAFKSIQEQEHFYLLIEQYATSI